jgi:hypothetical protein
MSNSTPGTNAAAREHDARKHIARMAVFAKIEALALVNELRDIRDAAELGESPNDMVTFCEYLHHNRLAAHANIKVIQDALVTLGNEVDKIGAQPT